VARKRIPEYCGPKRTILREALTALDASGDYVCEEKHDGEWCLVWITDGRVSKLRTRTGAELPRAKAAGVLGLEVAINAPALLAGELVADEAYGVANGQRRLHLFDVLEFAGTDCRDLAMDDRRNFLVCVQAALGQTRRVQIVEQRESGFVEFLDEITGRGGEGVVIKKRDSTYNPRNADGKIEGWLRCKPKRTVDYVVLSHGTAEGGTPNLELGLYKDSRVRRSPLLLRAMTVTIPKAMRDIDPDTLVGRVVEVEGQQVFKSGAIRHGQITRIRDDKVAKECTLAAARLA
jgi:ATP-dependent DNA ligase